MSAYIPYAVLAAVIIVFFVVCYLVFREKAPADTSMAEPSIPKDYYEKKRRDHGAAYRRADEEKRRAEDDARRELPIMERRRTEVSDLDTTRPIERVRPAEPEEAFEPMEATQIMPAPEREFTKVAATAAQRPSVTPEPPVPPEPIREEEVVKPYEAPASELTGRFNKVSDTEATATAAGLAGASAAAATTAATAGTVAGAAVVPPTSEALAGDDDRTLIMPAIHDEEADDATRIIPVVKADTPAAASTAAAPLADTTAAEVGADDVLSMVTMHFIRSFGVVGESSKLAVQDITAEALQRLHIDSTEELRSLMENIVVQEALLCMQKAYVAMPAQWMKATAIEAFTDVVRQPKSSTPYLVAFDALRILPHLHLGHFQIMSIALLLQYSRNSNNYSLEHFRHYTKKYLEPFLSDLPKDESMYRQLDYLRCTVQEQRRLSFTEMMANSYPFVFNFRGFTIDELDMALGGERIDKRFIVKSLNSSLHKLAVVDEGLAPKLFRMARISDAETQQRLLQLMKGRPTAFNGAESIDILDHISPVLPGLASVYDSTPLSRMSLTLLGLYLGRAHVKATIGEEFDLSPWF